MKRRDFLKSTATIVVAPLGCLTGVAVAAPPVVAAPTHDTTLIPFATIPDNAYIRGHRISVVPKRRLTPRVTVLDR